jgi:hypothetical protein
VRTLIGIAFGLLTAGCSVVGIRSGTEEPHYTVVQTVGAVEIRRYGERVAIETAVDADEMDARSRGFQRLASYIFGKNRARTTIAMTAPVSQARETIAMTAPVAQDRDAAGRWRIRFFAPSAYTVDTMPAPDDPAVSVVAVPAQTIAVFKFTGSRSPDAIAAHRTMLLDCLAGTGWTPQGEAVAWFYDPPWTIPFLRRNEVAVAVARRSSPGGSSGE